MRSAEVRKYLEHVGVRLEAARRARLLGEAGEAIVDDVVGENSSIGILRGLRRIEAQHVGQNALGVDRGDCFFARVAARMTEQMDELVGPSLLVVNWLARVVFQLGIVGVE